MISVGDYMEAETNESSEMYEEEEETVNPCPPEHLTEEDKTILRGDAIGDTAYSHRWILKCLSIIAGSASSYCMTKGDLTGCISDVEVMPISDDASYSCGENTGEIMEEAMNQLLQMTTSADVVQHLLRLEFDILFVANEFILYSRSQEYKNIMMSIVANITCQDFGIKHILSDRECPEIMMSVLSVINTLSEPELLCEAFRLLCNLAHYRSAHLDEPSDIFLPTWQELCNKKIVRDVMRILEHSESELLRERILDFLSYFLNFNEPKLHIINRFSKKEIVHKFIDVLAKEYHNFKINPSENELKNTRRCAGCIYAFLGEKGAQHLNDDVDRVSTLEAVLVLIVEHECNVDTALDLTLDKVISIRTSISILTFLIPVIKKPSILSLVGRLLVIATNSKTKEALGASTSDNSAEKKFFELKREELLKGKSTPYNSTPKEKTSLFGLDKAEDTKKDGSSFNNYDSPASSNTVSCGWMSPPQSVEVPSEDMEKSELEKCTQLTDEMEELKKILEDYCCYLFGCWWFSPVDQISPQVQATRDSILEALDQCHVHEVILVLNCPRKTDIFFVPKLQESLLNSSKHNRLVIILSHMYQ